MPLRFTIRDLFWLVLVAAILAAWLTDTLRWEQTAKDNQALKMNATLMQAEIKRLDNRLHGAEAVLDRHPEFADDQSEN